MIGYSCNNSRLNACRSFKICYSSILIHTMFVYKFFMVSRFTYLHFFVLTALYFPSANVFRYMSLLKYYNFSGFSFLHYIVIYDKVYFKKSILFFLCSEFPTLVSSNSTTLVLDILSTNFDTLSINAS